MRTPDDSSTLEKRISYVSIEYVPNKCYTCELLPDIPCSFQSPNCPRGPSSSLQSICDRSAICSDPYFRKHIYDGYKPQIKSIEHSLIGSCMSNGSPLAHRSKRPIKMRMCLLIIGVNLLVMLYAKEGFSSLRWCRHILP